MAGLFVCVVGDLFGWRISEGARCCHALVRDVELVLVQGQAPESGAARVPALGVVQAEAPVRGAVVEAAAEPAQVEALDAVPAQDVGAGVRAVVWG